MKEKMMSIATYIIIKHLKHVFGKNHSEVRTRIYLETTHRAHNDALAGM